MQVLEDRVPIRAGEVIEGIDRAARIAGAGQRPCRQQRRRQIGYRAAHRLRETLAGERVLLLLERPHADDQPRDELDCELPRPARCRPRDNDECADYLSAELLALRGWAGIVRQIEERPDRVPARDLTVTFADSWQSACCSNVRRSTMLRDNSPSAARCRTCAPGCGTGSAPACANGARAGVAAVSCRAALRTRCVDCRAVDRPQR